MNESKKAVQTTKDEILAFLAYQKEVGIDVLLSETPQNRFTQEEAPKLMPKAAQKLPSARQSRKEDVNDLVDVARQQAGACTTLAELKEVLAAFEGGEALKAGAKNCVFSDGNPKARVMLIGEAPGRDEDTQGLPFVGRSGQLLEKILASIGLARHNQTPDDSIYITNIIPWRPPANRTPTDAETNMFLPFVQKHVMLIQPKILLFAGGTSAKIMLATKTGIKTLRGKWHDWSATDVNGQQISCLALPTLHPAYLLRNPVDKRLVWQDMLILREKLDEFV